MRKKSDINTTYLYEYHGGCLIRSRNCLPVARTRIHTRLSTSIYDCLSISSGKKYMYAPRFCMNTSSHLGMTVVICSLIRMCESKHREFYHGIIYKAKEGRHVRILFNAQLTVLSAVSW